MFLILQRGIFRYHVSFQGVSSCLPLIFHRCQPRTTHHWYLSMSKVFFFACVPWCWSLSQSVRTKLPKNVPSEVMVGCRWLFWPVWAQLPNLCAKRPVPRASMWPTAFSAPWWMIPEGFWVGIMRNPLESVASFGILFGFLDGLPQYIGYCHLHIPGWDHRPIWWNVGWPTFKTLWEIPKDLKDT